MTAPAPPPIIGRSLALRRAVATLERYASTSLPILLVGATGTGKELFAQHAHARSGRRGPLVDVDCGALPRDMIEGLLFGYRRGAFTSATEDREGLFEAADGGTLFLDELASLPEEGQRKLLRVLDTAEVRRLGETRKRAVRLRVVAALEPGAAWGSEPHALRRDLYQRVAGAVIQLPPLSERPEDILALAHYFGALQGQVLGPGAEQALEGYDWPGNVRELRQVIERAGPMVENGILPTGAIAAAIDLGAVGCPAEPQQQGVDPVLAACVSHGWHAGRTAAALGIARSTLYLRLHGLGVSLREAKRSQIVRHCSTLFEQSQSMSINRTAAATPGTQ